MLSHPHEPNPASQRDEPAHERKHKQKGRQVIEDQRIHVYGHIDNEETNQDEWDVFYFHVRPSSQY